MGVPQESHLSVWRWATQLSPRRSLLCHHLLLVHHLLLLLGKVRIHVFHLLAFHVLVDDLVVLTVEIHFLDLTDLFV